MVYGNFLFVLGILIFDIKLYTCAMKPLVAKVYLMNKGLAVTCGSSALDLGVLLYARFWLCIRP